MSAAKNTGGPAFPSVREWKNDGDQLAHAPNGAVVQAGGVEQLHEPGMALRDYFAAQAMHALLSIDGTTYFENRAAAAYEMADAMLEERQK